MSVGDVEQDTGTLLTAVGTVRIINVVRQRRATNKQAHRYFPHSPDWLIRLVTDVEAPPLELYDVSLLQGLQTGISKHLLLHLWEPE